MAGQIAMVPANLSVISGGIHAQVQLSLRHVDRVLSAVSPGCSFHDIISCVCYVSHPSYITVAKQELARVTEKVRFLK